LTKTLLITRPIADPVIAQAQRLFEVTINESGALDEAAVTQALKTYDAILPTLGDEFTAKAFADAGDALRCKMLGNFGVGYNHIDVAAAHAHGVQVSNTPDVLTSL